MKDCQGWSMKFLFLRRMQKNYLKEPVVGLFIKLVPATSGMLKWEVDEFHGEDEGLIIAEIELPSEDTQFDKPQWLGKEVTQDTTYYNSTLSKTSWKAIQKSYAEAKAWEDWRDSLVKK